MPNPGGFVFGMILGVGLLLLLAGCAGAPRWGSWSRIPTTAQVQATRGPREHHVYVPAYEVYYNTARARYLFLDGQGWVTQADPPRGVTVGMLFAAPSVALDFTDPPARHHAAVKRMYPRNWGPGSTVAAAVRHVQVP